MGGDGGEKERSEEWDGGEGPGVVVVVGEMRSLVAERGSCSPPPPCKGTPPHSPQSKGHPAPLHSSRKGAQASAMPFRKKAPLWRFFGGAGCFFASFFFTRFFFFFFGSSFCRCHPAALLPRPSIARGLSHAAPAALRSRNTGPQFCPACPTTLTAPLQFNYSQN